VVRQPAVAGSGRYRRRWRLGRRGLGLCDRYLAGGLLLTAALLPSGALGVTAVPAECAGSDRTKNQDCNAGRNGCIACRYAEIGHRTSV